MTGTPTPNGPTDAYGLAKLVNNAFGETYTSYKSRVMVQLSQFKWVPKPGSHLAAHRLLQPSIRYHISDCIDLPPCTTQTRDVELSPEQAKAYKEMKNQAVAMIRDGHDRAFEVLFDRYQSRLLSFCRHMVGSSQDAEDLLQEAFVAAHSAMLADERPITARPWLYRIARNRCLNFLRKPVADGQDSMDVHPHANGTTTFERVQRREELRTIVADVQELPETQRSALVLREIDGLTYTEIAQAMGITLAAVKSLLVRARMALAEASEARILACDDVRLELAEAAEGLGKVSGPARLHVKACPSCQRFRGQLRSTSRSLAGLARIVRHRDRNDLEHADRESLVAVEPVDMAHPFEAVGDDGERAKRRPHRRAVPRGEGRYAADMIRMLMGDEDCRQVAWREPEAFEARFGIAKPEAAVDQYAGAAGLDDEAVALAAAAQ
jgi:RNA polymerase sigma factor (sigma-70 family)